MRDYKWKCDEVIIEKITSSGVCHFSFTLTKNLCMIEEEGFIIIKLSEIE